MTTQTQFLNGVSHAQSIVQRVGVVWFAVILLYAVSGLFSPGMFQVSQVLNILQVAAFLGVVAAGQTLALLTGGIDLSVAGVVTMANIVSTSIMAGRDGNMFMAVATCILLAATVGLINGLMITIIRVAPLIATLGMNSILFGWQLYAVGANSTAARMMGIPVRRIVIVAYILSSVMAVLGGLLLTSYIGSSSLGIGDQFLLSSIAATIVGGTALTGGMGSVIGTIGGTLFITELNSFTTIVRVSTGTQFVLQGAVIALSVLLYRFVGLSRVSG